MRNKLVRHWNGKLFITHDYYCKLHGSAFLIYILFNVFTIVYVIVSLEIKNCDNWKLYDLAETEIQKKEETKMSGCL